MKNTLELLEERITNINTILGDLIKDEEDPKAPKYSSQTTNFKNLTEAISFLQKSVSEHDSIHFKEVLKKCK